jgi:hypothetical protein
MGSLTALLLATPIFGFALHAPALEVSPLAHPGVALEAGIASPHLVEPGGPLSAKNVAAAGLAAKAVDKNKREPDASQSEYIQQIKTRNQIAGIHRILGLSTWGAMTVTALVGFLDYYNHYGLGAGIGDNPCVKGTAAFGDEFGCGGLRTLKSIAAYTTTALYASTFTLSLLMPDPDDLASGKGEFASTLRMHKLLRWVHFGGMIAQIALGVLIAGRGNALDRANDYGTMQALATTHLALGLVTYGALTWAGALMTF